MLPCWVVKGNSQKRLAPLDESRPNDRQVYPQAQVTSAEESGPVRAGDSGPVRANEFTDEGMVQEAEEAMFQHRYCHPKLKWRAHNVSQLPFRSWFCACVRGQGLSLGHRRFDAKTKEAEQIPTISVDCGFFGQPEYRAHDTLPVLIVRDRKSKGIRSHPVPSKGVVHPYPARGLMSDLDFTGYKRVILKSDQEPSLVALCDAVKNGWHGEVVPEAAPKGESTKVMERSSVRSSLCMDLREPSRTSWYRSPESLWNSEARCRPGWLSSVPIFFYSSTKVNLATVTLP